MYANTDKPLKRHDCIRELTFNAFLIFREKYGLCVRLFVCALWSPAGKGLTSWLSFVVYNCEFVTFPLINKIHHSCSCVIEFIKLVQKTIQCLGYNA